MPTARTAATPATRDDRRRSDASGAALEEEECKELLAATLDFASALRHHESREEPSSRLAIGHTMQRRGLGARHISALLTVALHGPMSVTQLAKRQRLTLKTASLIAVELQQAGLVDRHEDPADRRRTILQLAAGKERMINKGLANRAEHLRRTLERLTPQQREGLITGLQVLAEEMTRPPD
jgi:DNA-binding MarR family transcriptional regulator